MLLPALLQTSLALILAQSAIDTSGCEVFWLDNAGFGTATAVELADVAAMGELNGIDVAVVCQKLQATVTVSSKTVATCPPLVRRISLYDSPENTRTRTLALTVADTITDYRDGVSTCRWAAAKAAMSREPGKSTRAQQGTQLNAANAPVQSAVADTLMSRHLSSRRHMLEFGVLTTFSHPHVAPSLRWAFSWSRWRLGVWGAGMQVGTDEGTAITGAASAYLGLTTWGIATSNGRIGELNLGVMLGAVHGIGMATAPSEDERHTRPLAAAEMDFTFLINPQKKGTLGLRIFTGWMLGMWLGANDKVMGGLNGFYGGAGLEVRLNHGVLH